VKRKRYQHEPVSLKHLWWALAGDASDGDATPIVLPDRPDQVILRYVRELAQTAAALASVGAEP
jgi:hypothetical protein